MCNIKDISGMMSGRIEAIEPTNLRISGSVVWKCKCDCGNATLVGSRDIVSKRVQSCGCLRIEILNKERDKGNIDGTRVDVLRSKKIRSDNTSGVKGVGLDTKTNKWRAIITFKGKKYYLGVYFKLEDAIKARKMAESEIHDRFVEWYDANVKSISN